MKKPPPQFGKFLEGALKILAAEEEAAAALNDVTSEVSRDWEQTFRDVCEFQDAMNQEKLEEYKKSITMSRWWRKLTDY